MKTRLLPLLALCLLPAPVISGPDATTNHLMNDSVSMLDFGLLRLNLRLEVDDLGSARFDWDENRIKIVRFFFDREIKDDPEKTCAAWVSNVRLRAGVRPTTGETFFANSLFADLFLHYGFRRSPVPDNLLTDIDKIMVLECLVEAGSGVEVTAPLVGKGYSVVRQP